MPVRFRLELDLVLDAETQARLIESARQLCMRDARMAEGVPGEVIDGSEDALIELVERNPLLVEATTHVECISCGPVTTLPDPLTPAVYMDSLCELQNNWGPCVTVV
jgi:hypothetical protein